VAVEMPFVKKPNPKTKCDSLLIKLDPPTVCDAPLSQTFYNAPKKHPLKFALKENVEEPVWPK
jgi:hypothetical protein